MPFQVGVRKQIFSAKVTIPHTVLRKLSSQKISDLRQINATYHNPFQFQILEKLLEDWLHHSGGFSHQDNGPSSWQVTLCSMRPQRASQDGTASQPAWQRGRTSSKNIILQPGQEGVQRGV